MSLSIATDILTKVGGVLATVGMFAGGWINASTTCTAQLGGGQVCRNIFGEVGLNAAGQPDVFPLAAVGALVGALVGFVLGLIVAWIAPSKRENLFP